MKIYEYEARFVVDNNGERYSYSKKRYGELMDLVLEQTIQLQQKIQNPFKVQGSYTILYYWCQQDSKTYEILIDTEDLDKVKKYYWTVRKSDYTNYAYTRPNKKNIHLHRFINESQEGEEVDHINRDGLDNRRDNLRNVSPSLNQKNKSIQSNNTSGVTGVDYSNKHNKWRARWSENKKVQYALFNSFEEAVEHRKRMERKNGYLQEGATTIERGL